MRITVDENHVFSVYDEEGREILFLRGDDDWEAVSLKYLLTATALCRNIAT
jgi:hypothetical protein